MKAKQGFEVTHDWETLGNTLGAVGRCGSPRGNLGSVIVPQNGSINITQERMSYSCITVFVWGKNTILKFVGNTVVLAELYFGTITEPGLPVVVRGLVREVV